MTALKALAMISVVVLITTVTSCQKPSTRLSYTLSATYDTSDKSRNVVDVSAKKTGGDDDLIALTVEGLPDYISADMVQPSRELPWTVPITFSFNNAAAAGNAYLWHEYTVTIKATSNAGTVRKATVTFSCSPASAIPAFDNREFLATGSCTKSGSIYTWFNTSTLGGDTTIYILDLYSNMLHSYDVPVTINARTQTITMSPYTVDGMTFSGSGSFFSTSDNAITFNLSYKRTTGSTTDSCSATFQTNP